MCYSICQPLFWCYIWKALDVAFLTSHWLIVYDGNAESLSLQDVQICFLTGTPSYLTNNEIYKIFTINAHLHCYLKNVCYNLNTKLDNSKFESRVTRRSCSLLSRNTFTAATWRQWISQDMFPYKMPPLTAQCNARKVWPINYMQ